MKSLRGTAARLKRSSQVDLIDVLSLVGFVVTITAEARILRHRARAEAGGPDSSTPISDKLVPLGYERRDTTASLSMLVGNAASDLITGAVLSRTLKFLFRHRVADVSSRRGAFVVSLVLWDFLYYWNHRWMHEVRLFWANHVTHHSSRHYNLSTALRQPWSSFLLSWVFMPLPVLGVNAHHARRARQIDLLYQYWIHTETIDRLPRPVEAVFNTPSHHRVHHGVNPQYLDKNHGGILIIWDKWFGTFEPEAERVEYGLTTNIDTYNPLRIAYHEFIDIGRDVKAAEGRRTRLRHIFGRPGWRPTSASAEPRSLPS